MNGEQAAVPVRNIVFDIGNVIVRWDPQAIAQRALGEHHEAEARALALFTEYESWLALNRGEITLEELRQAYARDHALEEPQVERLVAELFASLTLIEETAVLMRRLAGAGYRLFAISDNVHEIVAHLKESHDFWPLFEAAVISAELGVMKPDPRIFRHLLEEHRLDPAETVFFDDLEANVRGAEAVGMHARLFTGARQAERDLVELGVTLAPEAAA